MSTSNRIPFRFELEDAYLTSQFSGKIVSCTEGGEGALVANADRASTCETIVPEPQPNGTVAFRSKFSNLYISVVDGTDRLVPSVPWIREWEIFRAFRCDPEDDTAFVLQSCKNGKFVRVYVNSDPAYLVADCDTPDTWEQFRLHPIRRFQAENLNAARRIGANGIVLLKNDENMLPIAPGSEIVLLGVTGYACHRMGVGSGDMLAQNTIQYDYAMREAGIRVFKPVADIYHDFISSHADTFNNVNTRWLCWTSRFPEPKLDESIFAGKRDRPCLVVIGRNLGEAADLKNEEGSFILHPEEVDLVRMACAHFNHVAVLLNVCGPLDISALEGLPVQAILVTSLLGEMSGRAVADVVTGAVNPAGRLTATWAKRYEDYPTTAGFGRLEIPYHEGIFVGYRYFDTFGVAPRYPFGFGLSYTTFSIAASAPRVNGTQVVVDATVTNTGNRAGAQVVQCYLSEPDGELEKAYQQLCAFVKTPVLVPGESKVVTLAFDLSNFASYCEKTASFLLDPGDYFVRVGSHSRDTHVVGVLRLAEEVVTMRTVNRCVADTEDLARLHLLSKMGATPFSYPDEIAEKATAPVVMLSPAAFRTTVPSEPCQPRPLRKQPGQTRTLADVLCATATTEEVVAQFSRRELADFVNGKVIPKKSGEWNSGAGGENGAVFGEAAEFCSSSRYGIPASKCADGPSGVRLSIFGDHPYKTEMAGLMVALPSGTALAQGWDTVAAERFGRCILSDLELADIDGWLAPGLNIQRNPLCGRNFEYFSEDPLVSGRMAAAIVRGVQIREGGRPSGRYLTLKHFCGNNQETDRGHENNIISERALREIYLRGFEYGVREGHPISLMTSYNKVNGRFCATNAELLNGILRAEWGFDGFVMTDWWNEAPKNRHQEAGNDAIMPGKIEYRAEVEKGLTDGSIDRAAVQASAVRILDATLNGMKHGSQSVVPSPRSSSKIKDELFVLKPEARIGWQGENAREMAELLADYLRPATGYELPVVEGTGDITLETTNSSSKPDETGFVSEQYAVSVRGAGIHLRAENDFGLARAIQTLRQLFPATVYSSTTTDSTPWIVEGVDIEDSPKFRWRGQHLDVSRHFFTREEVERFIELLAQHKLNIFHWHLTDDQGWRIEIKKYPKLTEIGGIRTETFVGRDFNQPDCQYDGTPYGGFYTQEDIRHVVEFARLRRITIVPEIDMPGHMAAAITAYPELGNYPGRQIQVRTRWGISKETLNCNEATVQFCKDVWEEVMALFPGKFLHIGGDEAPHDEWEECGTATKLGLPSTADIQPRFTAELVSFFEEHGRRLIGWDEIANGGRTPDKAAVMWWRENGIGMQAMNAGHDVVYANSRHLYFDGYYDDADKESGAVPRTFDRFVNEKSIFDAVGQIDTRLLGAQGQLWTEYIPNMNVLENRAFPRIAAMAEALWSSRLDFTDFSKRMQRQNVRYFVQKVNVYIPDCIPLVDNGSQMVDIPDGSVCLVAKNANKIVACEDWGRAPLAATLDAFDNNHGESIVVEKQCDGAVAFKNVYTGKYISVTDDGSLLKAEGPRVDLWELFDIYPFGHFDGGFVLRSRKNGKFVTVDEHSGNRLAAICDGNPRSWEVLSFLSCDKLQKHVKVFPTTMVRDNRTYRLMFEDYFRGNAIDSSKWELCPEGPRQDIGGRWADSEVSVHNGNLWLRARIRQDGIPVSGGIRSRGKFEQLRGYFECRMMFPKTTGFWGAFWMMCGDVGKVDGSGVSGSELDIIESGECARRGVNHAIHWDGYGTEHKSTSHVIPNVPELYEGWHVYALEWTEKDYAFFIDGKETWRTIGGGVCEHPGYLKLTTEFGKWAAPIVPEQLPDFCRVDWVRVWQEV